MEKGRVVKPAPLEGERKEGREGEEGEAEIYERGKQRGEEEADREGRKTQKRRQLLNHW